MHDHAAQVFGLAGDEWAGAVERAVATSTSAQGIPEHIDDDVVLERVVALLGTNDIADGERARGGDG